MGGGRERGDCLLSQKSKQLIVSGFWGVNRGGRKLVSGVPGVSLTGGYLLCGLPEVSGVRQPAVQLGQLLQHVGQLGEGGPVPQVVGPAGGQDLLKGGGGTTARGQVGATAAAAGTHARLTDTSLPRLISASTFFTPSPLPTCQMVASTGWLVMGQSRACSSYQIVLKGRGKKKNNKS